MINILHVSLTPLPHFHTKSFLVHQCDYGDQSDQKQNLSKVELFKKLNLCGNGGKQLLRNAPFVCMVTGKLENRLQCRKKVTVYYYQKLWLNSVVCFQRVMTPLSIFLWFDNCIVKRKY